jgi:UDP-glucose 4,6-dehydratase
MSSWKRSILLTGAAGFIGSHVAIRLVTLFPDYLIIGLDSMEYCASVKNLDQIINAPNFRLVEGDILSTDFVRYLLKEHKIDTVMHFAAQSHVDNSFGNSLEFTRTNTLGTHTLLECARLTQAQIKLFIYVSTDEVYGENTVESGAFHEQYVLSPQNPYAASKAAGEMFARSYFHSFKMPIIITRGNNTFGPHQYPEKLIPKFINLIERSKKCCLHGDGSNMRSFVFCEDVAEAFDIIMHKGQIGETYNIGTKFEISNKDVTKTLLKLMKPEVDAETQIEYVRDRAINDKRYWVNYDKIAALGWVPRTSFEDGLARTIEWYRTHPAHWGDVSQVLVAHPQMPASSHHK